MDKRSHAPDPTELRRIPAVNATRTGGTRKPRTRTKALSDCVSIQADGTASIFKPLRKRNKQRTRITQVRDTRPEVLKLQHIIGNSDYGTS